MTAIGRPPLNLNEDGQSTAVRLRIYPLADDAAFRAATIDELWVKDDEVLKKSMTGTKVVVDVTPAGAGEAALPIEVAYGDGTKFLGVFAMFRKGDARDQRTLVIPVDRAGGARLVLTGSSVALDGK